MKAAAQIAVLVGALAAPALAQGQNNADRPLDQIVQDGAEMSVLALHCAGLFHSVWDFMGEAALGADAAKQTKDNTALFLEAGKKLRIAETDSTEADVSKAVIAEAFAVSGRYYARYKENVAAGRDAFATDEVWSADLQICRNLAAQF